MLRLLTAQTTVEAAMTFSRKNEGRMLREMVRGTPRVKVSGKAGGQTGKKKFEKVLATAIYSPSPIRTRANLQLPCCQSCCISTIPPPRLVSRTSSLAPRIGQSASKNRQEQASTGIPKDSSPLDSCCTLP
jgi:hypothetical protein